MKVLVVDDNNDKIDKIVRCLIAQADMRRDDIETAYTVFDARRALADTTFDLLILDVMLPFRAGDPPRSENTVGFLTELRDRPTLKKPRHIIGLTAYDEGLRQLAPVFQEQAWAIVKYASDSSEWSEQIVRSVRWIARIELEQDRPQFSVDVCLITALDTPEYDALLRAGWDWEAAEPIDDTTFARRGRFTSQGREYVAVAACSPRMGMVPAALLAAKMIVAKRPKYLVMTGICAGVKGRANYGDPVLADPCWDWQSGKHVLKEGEREFEIAPDQIGTPERIRTRWDALRGDRQFWENLKAEWPGAPDTDLRLRIGPSVSGSSVLADQDMVEVIKRQHRALVSLEMEAYGVMSAARAAPSPRPVAFTCKSVCDFADDLKDDRWQTYAAFTSARAVREFFERYMCELDGLAREY